MRFVHEPEFPGNLEIFNRFLDQHPSVPALVQEGIQESVKISDFATLSQWRRTDLYNNWFRLQGLDYQLAFLTTDPHLRLGITLNRREPPLFQQFDRARISRSRASLHNRTRSATIVPKSKPVRPRRHTSSPCRTSTTRTFHPLQLVLINANLKRY